MRVRFRVAARSSPARSSRLPAALRVAALAIGALVLLAGDAWALTIRGRVLKGEERSPSAGIAVSLHVIRGEEELPGRTVKSGSDGSFRFDGITSQPDVSYFLSTEYEGAFYTEGPLEVAHGGDAVTKDLVIYDVGRDLASVRVTHHHLVVERHEDHLQVTEILVFRNSGSTAYLGVGLNHAENAGARIGLPASVDDFEPGVGGDEQTVRVQGRDLASLRPIPPGERPFSFSYHIPLSGRMDLSHRLYFPTDKIVVMMGDTKLRLESSMLQYAGPREQGGKTFEIWEASNLPVGAEVPMRIQGAGFWSNPKIYPWLAAPFVIVAVLVFAAKRGRRAAVPHAPGGHGGPAAHPEHVPFPATPAPAARASRRAPQGGGPSTHAGDGSDDEFAHVYLYLIDALDRGLERGEFSAETHALIRGNLKRRLEAILADQSRTGTR